MQDMQITPDEQRFLLYLISAFYDWLDETEQREAGALQARIQANRSLTKGQS